MRSESRETREAQKAYWENQLRRRLSALTEKGVEPEVIAKDTEVRRIRAEVRKANSRLRVISAKEKKIVDMAEAREERRAAPKKKDRAGKEGEAEKAAAMSKRQQKKRKKMAEKDAQEGEE